MRRLWLLWVCVGRAGGFAWLKRCLAPAVRLGVRGDLKAEGPPWRLSARAEGTRGWWWARRPARPFASVATSDALDVDVVRRLFAECDLDDDGLVRGRELVVLMWRLHLRVESRATLQKRVESYDVDENGAIDVDEFVKMSRALLLGGQGGRALAPPFAAAPAAPAAPAVASLLPEEEERRRRRRRPLIPRPLAVARSVFVGRGEEHEEEEEEASLFSSRSRLAVPPGAKEDPSQLWAEVFGELDTDGDGSLSMGEVRSALGQLGFLADARAGPVAAVVLRRYDDDVDGRLSFDEFRRLAVDVVSSVAQFDLAVKEAESRIFNNATRLSEAARRAARANEHTRRMSSANETEEAVLAELRRATAKPELFDTAAGVHRFQDLLYRRFKARRGGLVDDALTAERVLLLEAIRHGDVDAIRALTWLDWDFVYPPRPPGDPGLEAWCRTPLGLLVRPDEGNFEPMLRGVSEEDRLGLIKDILACGCADANYPAVYWSAPAVHACFEGDAAVLDLLAGAKCDFLSQRVLWALQAEPRFSLVHAAAFNNQVKALQYLRHVLPPSVFKDTDAQGNNALHIVLDSARENAKDVCDFLIDVGVDGFARNADHRSGLSLAIEYCPEVAKKLLETKSRFEYRWWGQDLYWFSLDGIVLPLCRTAREESDDPPLTETTAASSAGDPQEEEEEENEEEEEVFCWEEGGVYRPLSVRDESMTDMPMERMILKYGRKELLETPVMLDLLERKWAYFAQRLYQERTVTYTAMTAAVLVASVTDPSTSVFRIAATVAAATWGLYFRGQLALSLARVATRDRGVSLGEAVDRLRRRLNFFNYLDTFSFVGVPCLLAAQVDLTDAVTTLGGAAAAPNLAPLVGALQVALALRLLDIVSIFESLGPLLITVLSLLSDAGRFSTLLLIVILASLLDQSRCLGFANGFYSLIHFGVPQAELQGLTFDYSYTNIISQMLLWLTGNPDPTILDDLHGDVFVGAEIFFWSFLGTAYFILVNLLIAIFNATYEDVISKAKAEWLFIRLRTCLEFEENIIADPRVQLYYKNILDRDGKRAVQNDRIITKRQSGDDGSADAAVTDDPPISSSSSSQFDDDQHRAKIG